MGTNCLPRDIPFDTLKERIRGSGAYIDEEFICSQLDTEYDRYEILGIRGLDVRETEGMNKVSSIALSEMMI